MAAISVDTYGFVPEGEDLSTPPFWFLLAMGVGWILLSFLVLQFTYSSVLAVTLIVGILLLLAGVSEIAEAFAGVGWRWLHLMFGGLLILGGIFTFVYPGETFGTLSLIFGWYLLLKGTFDIVLSLMMHGVHLWWLGLVAGFAEIALAFWAVTYVGRSAALLLLWIGLGALMRGISTLVAAFRLRRTGAVA